MEKKKSQESQVRILYAVLAALLVTVMVISVITAVNKKNKKPEAPLDTEPAVTTSPTVTNVHSLQTQPPEEIPETQAPVTQPPATETVPPETEKPKEDKPTVSRAYVVPTQGEVMKDFSVDMPVYSLTMNDYRAHKGIDIAAEYGEAVCSFTDGTVEKITVDPMMGVTVTVDHGEGLKTNYCNLQQTLPDGIEAGVSVKAGDVIGAVGDTTLVELAEASHLHFEVTENGKYVDPADYLPVLKPTEE